MRRVAAKVARWRAGVRAATSPDSSRRRPAPPALQHLAKLPMRRLVPRGFVFIFVEKQHVQALCRQVHGVAGGRGGANGRGLLPLPLACLPSVQARA